MEEYNTISLYEASYLLCKGYKPIRTIPSGKKSTIVFENSIELIKEVMSYHNKGEAPAKKLTECYQEIKDLVFNK